MGPERPHMDSQVVRGNPNDDPPGTVEEANAMRKSARVLHNSLISLVLAAAIPAAWATDPPKAADPPKISAPAQTSSKPPTPRVLDVKPPDIHKVMSAQQIAAAIPNPDDSEVEAETVAVRGETPAPYVPGGFAALYWAATHPVDSWRILAPVQ
jgi:hypothetical protein